MRFLTLLLIFLSVFFSVKSQQPEWIVSSTRELLYPSSKYYTGYSLREVGTDTGKALSKATDDALEDLSRSISSIVESSSELKLSTYDNGKDYHETESLNSQTSIQANSRLADVGKQVYIDTKTSKIHVLVYVEKKKLISYYESMVSLIHNECRSLLKEAVESIDLGNKPRAVQLKPILDKKIASIRNLQKVMTDVTQKLPDTRFLEDLENESGNLSRMISKGVVIFAERMKDTNLEDSNFVIDKMKGNLSQQGCTFTDKPEDADFIISISASTRSGSVFDEVYHNFADVRINIINKRKDAVIYEDVLTTKGSAVSNIAASRKSLENSISKLTKNIITILKQ